MSDTSNVFPMPGTPDAGGVRQQRYRRGQSKPRKTRAQRKADALLSEHRQEAEATVKTAASDAWDEQRNTHDPNDVVTRRMLPRYASQDAVRAAAPHAEFPPAEVSEDGGKADALDWLARLVAIGMAIVTAYFSIHGLLTLFPGDEIGVTVFGIGVECLKVVGVMYLSAHARSIWWLWRWLAIVAIFIAASLNSASVYAKFASLHSQSPAATREASAAELDARIEQYQGKVNDLTRRAAVIDDTMDNGGKKTNAKGAKQVLGATQPQRTGLSTDRDAAANELARLKAQRGRVTAADHQATAEELPLLLMANLTGTDIATVLRWLVCAVVICGDPAALILLAAVGSRRKGGGA